MMMNGNRSGFPPRSLINSASNGEESWTPPRALILPFVARHPRESKGPGLFWGHLIHEPYLRFAAADAPTRESDLLG